MLQELLIIVCTIFITRIYTFESSWVYISWILARFDIGKILILKGILFVILHLYFDSNWLLGTKQALKSWSFLRFLDMRGIFRTPMARHSLLNVLLIKSLIISFAFKAHSEDLKCVSNQVFFYFII